MDKRLGFIGIILDDRHEAAARVNAVLGDHGDCIVGRMGIPNAEHRRCVITVVVNMTTDELGRATGKLGMIPGVTVRSALAKA